jgi:hypothetical protein
MSPGVRQPSPLPCSLPGLEPGSRKHPQCGLTLLPPGSRWVHPPEAIQPFLRKAYRHQQSSEADFHCHDCESCTGLGRLAPAFSPPYRAFAVQGSLGQPVAALRGF